MCDNVNLISTETFWQSSEMLMWWLVGILKWTVDWLSFYGTIKTALSGTTQRRMSSAYLLNFYKFFFLPFWNMFSCSWLACKSHIWISQKFKTDLYFKGETEITELHRLFNSAKQKKILKSWNFFPEHSETGHWPDTLMRFLCCLDNKIT